MTRWKQLLPFPMLMMSVGCGGSDDGGAISVSAIGHTPRMVANGDFASAELVRATAQGLVSFDADGQIEPALAERWIVTDDGLSTIFRIRRARWTNGRDVATNDVARIVRAKLATIAPLVSTNVEVRPMTGSVMELRLGAPQPLLLQMLAHPSQAVQRESLGTGPYRIFARRNGALVLRPVSAPDGSDDDLTEEEREARQVYFRGESAGRAVARFSTNRADAVVGGTFADLAVARAAKLSADRLGFDPASGLFGLAFIGGSSLTSDDNVRRALAMSVDRARIVQAFNVPGWQPAETILPARLDSAVDPAAPSWKSSTFNERIAVAEQIISQWRSRNAQAPALRIALPDGPGSRLLFAFLVADWGRIGVKVQRVAARAPADVRLIDEVAPAASVSWYLTRLSCGNGLPCDQLSDQALEKSRLAIDLPSRGNALAEADLAYAANTPFIPIATPLRWTLSAPRLTGFRQSPFAVHPLNRMRAVPR
jgi:oligopeptide transport system substrate-binding protein